MRRSIEHQSITVTGPTGVGKTSVGFAAGTCTIGAAFISIADFAAGAAGVAPSGGGTAGAAAGLTETAGTGATDTVRCARVAAIVPPTTSIMTAAAAIGRILRCLLPVGPIFSGSVAWSDPEDDACHFHSLPMIVSTPHSARH